MVAQKVATYYFEFATYFEFASLAADTSAAKVFAVGMADLQGNAGMQALLENFVAIMSHRWHYLKNLRLIVGLAADTIVVKLVGVAAEQS